MHRAATQTAIFTLVVSLALVVAGCDRNSQGRTGQGDAAVAAAVNGQNITLSEVEKIINQQAGGQQSQMSPLELAAARLQVVDNLIQQQVLFQRAEKEKLLPTEDEITTAIDSQKSRLTQEEWDKFLKDNNQTMPGLREEARKALAIQKLQEKTVNKAGSVSNSEIENFYNNNKERFVNARGVSLAGIIVDPQDNGFQDDAKNDVEAKAKIDRLYTQLKSGADFASVARASSEDQTNARGGDMGFFSEEELKRNGFSQELLGSLFGSMQIGSFAPPVEIGGRLFILKLSNRQLQNENLTLESPGVRDQIKEALVRQRQTLLNEALLRTAMSEAKIENYLAQNMLNDPNSLSALRPVSGNAANPSASPAPAATTAATPSGNAATTAATPTASPSSTAR